MVAGFAKRHRPTVALSLLLPCLVVVLEAGPSHADPGLSTPAPLRAAPVVNPVSESAGVLERIPTLSWAMGSAAGAALAAHALYQNLSERRRARLEGSCNEQCPAYRVDHYEESRNRADIALRLSVLAAASAVWLAYNDPGQVLDRLGPRKAPVRQRGFKLRVKPAHRGVWASVVAYF
jgi:hypothetical protein